MLSTCADVLRLASPANGHAAPETRAIAAWRAWLGALANDAQAALAAAIAYRALDPSDRDSWLAALEQDLVDLPVPIIAAYGPLLAVERDKARRERILSALGEASPTGTSGARIALFGRTSSGALVGAIVSPLYLDFVQVLACGYCKNKGFSWIRHDPISAREQAPRAGDLLEGVKLEAVPLTQLVDDLAYAVLAQRRSGQELPEVLMAHADLFTALSPVHVSAPAEH